MIRNFQSRVDISAARHTAFAFVTIMICTSVVAACLVSLNPALSANDEEVHLDYLIKVGHLHIPVAGEMMGQQALRIEACRGFYGPYQPPDVCQASGALDPTTFQFGGESRAWSHPPLYYVGTRLMLIPVALIWQSADFLDAARIAASLWTGLGLFLLWLTFRRLRITPSVTWSIVVILMLAQSVMQRAMTINNDGSAFFAGALLLYLVISRRGGLILGLGAFGVMLLKAQNAIAISTALFACAIGVSRIAEGGRVAYETMRLSLRTRQCVGIITGALVAYIAWRFAMSSGSSNISSVSEGLVRTDALPSLGNMFPVLFASSQEFAHPFGQGILESYLADARYQYLEFVLNTVFIGAIIGGVLFFRSSRRESTICLTAVFSVFIAPLCLTIMIAMAISTWGMWPARYGLSALPFVAAGTAVMVRSGFGSVVMIGIAGVSVLLFGSMLL